MKEHFIHTFLKTYFEENNCSVKEPLEGMLSITLTEKMDKTLMNRPFYWKYMEATNQQGEPLTLNLITDKEKRNEDGEWITYGSPRLQQIIRHLHHQAQFTRLFQVKDTNEQTMLQPWLVVNYCVSYEGKQKKEKLYSLGLHLITGVLISDMMEQLSDVQLNEVISHHCYTISPIIKPGSGFSRMEKYIDEQIEAEDHQWAIDSHQHLMNEIKMMDYFYQKDSDEEKKEQEMKAAKKRFAPVITHKVISGGLFYLDESFMKKPLPKNG